ncbi:MAG: tetratricopeptide repeat protein, partial [Pacificimonas sp.]
MNKMIFAGALAATVVGVASVAYCAAPEPGIAPQSMAFTTAGETLLNDRDADAAIQQFETALAVDPKNVRAYIGLARAHDMLGLP